ncbi:MAG: CHAT domain-containing protein [Pyrinomonadaceae bacterium]|nr:CHAT domain-containing protein [Pyrinomonadaceae bacterium]
MKSKRYILIFLFLIVFAVSESFVFSQEPTDISKLENEISLLNKKLNETAKADDREKIFRQIASLLNQISEIHFAKGEYESSTKTSLEADSILKKYHQSYYERIKIELGEAENKLKDAEKEADEEKRELLLKVQRILVIAYLKTLFEEAEYFRDETAQKTYLERLGQISREANDLSGEAESLEKLGQLLLNVENPQESFALFEKALALRQKDGRKEFLTVDYIANAHYYLGNYDQALEYFQKKGEITQEILAKTPAIKPEMTPTQKQIIELEKANVRTHLAMSIISIAQIKALQGKYGATEKDIAELQNIIEQIKSDEKNSDELTAAVAVLTRTSIEGSTARLRGHLLESQGEQIKAAQQFETAVNLFSQLSNGEPSGMLAALRARLALIYSSQNEVEKARANIREAMRIRSRLQQENGLAFALMQASRIELAAKQPDTALKFARQAKAAALQLAIEDISAEANEVEADALLVKNSDNNSLKLEQIIVGYKSAIEVYRKLELRPFLARSLNSLGIALKRADRLKEAEEAFKQAIEVIESIQSGFSNSEASASFLNRRDISIVYQQMVDLLISQGRSEAALQYATRAQRRDLVETLSISQVKLTGKSADILKEAAAAEQREKSARSNLEDTLGKADNKQNSYINQIGAARQDYALAIKKLEIEQPNLHFTVRPTDLLKLQNTIAPNEVLISYLVTSEKIYIFVVKRGTVAVRSVEIKQRDLLSLVAQVRDGLKNFADDFYAISTDAETGFTTEKSRPDLRNEDKSEHYRQFLLPLKTSLTRLNSILIAPVDDLLKDTEILKIIPNSELFLLPFSALISADNKYLLEKYNLVFLTAGDLINVPVKPSNGGLVAFGNPSEAGLDGALDEVKAIKTVFPNSRLFIEDKATKDQLFKVASAKILHFATHGNIRSPIEKSNIQLAHLPDLTNPDLTYGEIYALPLESTEMVVLSACQTALGTVSGTEVGVFIEAFRTKTKSVAASLWSVDDFATRELMTEFYRNLAKGESRAAALRTAQLKILRDGRMKNPLFWAAFVIYGNGGKLSGNPVPIKKSTTGKK